MISPILLLFLPFPLLGLKLNFKDWDPEKQLTVHDLG